MIVGGGTYHALVVGCCVRPIDHHVECLIDRQLLLRVIRGLILVLLFTLIQLRMLSELTALGPDEPVLFVADLGSNPILKLFINDTLLRWSSSCPGVLVI